MIDEQGLLPTRPIAQAEPTDRGAMSGMTATDRDDTSAEAEELRPMHDPESLNVRVAPIPVTRFRKGLLVGAAGAVLSAMAAVSWFALEPAIPPDAASQAAAAERQQRIAELTQARSAPVLMQVSRSSGPASVLAGATGSTDPGLTQAVVARSDDGINPNRLRPATSRWQVTAGSTIAASLITGLNSDVPGMIVAQVTEPVFDSSTGRAVLIPQGARLLGRYDSKVAFGQRRAMLVWERPVMPDDASIALDNAPATDAAGYAGLSDGVDFHTWQLLRGIGMSTLLGVGTELTFGDGEGDLVRALRESVQSNADRAGQKIVERNLDIAPTITIRPGVPVRVLVHKDLVLPPWRG